MVKATEMGYMNPANEQDWYEFRRRAGLKYRVPDKLDTAYIKRVQDHMFELKAQTSPLNVS
jgi:hypothetical protein